MTGKKLCEVVANPSFPSYSITAVSGRYLVIGGGGGAAKTGIKNKIDVYELYHTGSETLGERVLAYDIGDACVSNMVGWCGPITAASKSKVAPTIMLALGQEECCKILRLTPKLTSTKSMKDQLLQNYSNSTNIGNASPNNVRKRGKEKGIPTDDNKTVEKMLEEKKRKASINTTLRGDTYFSFTVEEMSNSVTVLRKVPIDDIYQKVVRISTDHKLLATGGTDGHVRIWRLPNMEKFHDIAAHDKEVDDLDFKPNNKEIVSVSKPSRECSVWNIDTEKQVTLLALQTNGIKYKFYKAKYATVEGNKSDIRLFTISNPVVGTKHPGIVAKWNGKTYIQEKSQSVQGTLSSLALSDNGRYLAAGTMDGNIYLVIAFSLQTLRVVEAAHSMFVTGLEWLPTSCPSSKIARGFSEASVLSISCDNTVKVHHIPRPGMFPIWLVVMVTAVVMISAFLFASYIGL